MRASGQVEREVRRRTINAKPLEICHSIV